MGEKQKATEFVKWIMKVQDSDSWFKHRDGIWYKHMVGHMTVEQLYDYWIESEGNPVNSENDNCDIFDVSVSLCNHHFTQTDQFWQKCNHCGMIKPLGQ